MKTSDWLPCITLVLLFNGCAGQTAHWELPEGVSPVAATWIWQRVAVPAHAVDNNGYSKYYSANYAAYPSYWLDSLEEDLKGNDRLPAVIFLHGCAGYQDYVWTYQHLLTQLGFVVFAPDSFQRPGRIRCGGGGMRARIGMRHAEIEYALDRIRELDWIDQERVVLMGQSEGGNSVAHWSKRGFSALVILGTNCRHNNGFISAPKDIPVLSLIGEHDRFYQGSCQIGRRENSAVLIMPGAGHDLSNTPLAEAAITSFLKAVVLEKSRWSAATL